MPHCSPQRYLANNANVLRMAALAPSSVMPVEDQVLETPVARTGTGAVVVEGAYTGAEAATYDVEIVDSAADNPIVTAPVASGVGSGTLQNIAAFGDPQTFTVELANEGVPELRAGVAFEGVRIVARTPGAVGNDLSIEIDRDGLVFTASPYSLLNELAAGAGGSTNGLEGPEYDWDAKVLSGDNIIPSNAHRVAFGEDTTNIYLSYKQFAEGEWRYHFVPAIRKPVPAGTIVKFVTGARTARVNDGGSPPESFAGIVTVYDLLNAVKSQSTLLDVVGIVAYDRSPTGQAARELLLRTDPHAEISSGSGSKYATGFADIRIGDGAGTELVTAECVAATSTDHPLARVGMERWQLRGSVSGALGEIVTGAPYTHPQDRFALTIPRKLPDNYGVPTGRFSLVDISYIPRDDEDKPPICPVAMTLGSEAVDQTITLEWTKRPSGDCVCAGMPVPKLSPFCLGLISTEGGSNMAYQPDTVARLVDLYEWYHETIVERSSFIDSTHRVTGNEHPAFRTPDLAESIREIVAEFEQAAAALDAVPDETDGLRDAGFAAWDAGVDDLKTDIEAAYQHTEDVLVSIPGERYNAAIRLALISGGISPLGKSDADTITSGDGCWLDMGGDYWKVVGSDKGAYAPCFNNVPYYACRASSDGKKYFSTKEFGFQLNVKCPDLLEYGDRITLQIGGAGTAATYQVGDMLMLPIIAAQDLQLAGGQNGNGILTWYVSGSEVGALPNFAYDPGAPTSYAQSGVLEFDYVPGGIPNKKGDKFTFNLEGGHWRWRKNGGAWVEDSPLAPISTVAQPLDSGLTVRFVPGASPSYDSGDLFTFRALQPWAVSNLKTPGAEKWRWSGAGASVVADYGSTVGIAHVAIARHTLPEGATITLEGGIAPGDYLWSESLTRREGVIFKELAAPRTARYLRLTIGSAPDAAIGWAYVGVAATTRLSADVQVRPRYRIEAGASSLDQGGRYLARSTSGELRFSEIALSDPDVAKLMAMVDWSKRNDDEPIVLVPNVERPDESYLMQWGVHEFAFVEVTGNNADPDVRERRYAIDIPMTGVWQA